MSINSLLAFFSAAVCAHLSGDDGLTLPEAISAVMSDWTDMGIPADEIMEGLRLFVTTDQTEPEVTPETLAAARAQTDKVLQATATLKAAERAVKAAGTFDAGTAIITAPRTADKPVKLSKAAIKRANASAPRKIVAPAALDMGEVREWLMGHGYDVKPLGRIKGEFIDAYRAAH